MLIRRNASDGKATVHKMRQPEEEEEQGLIRRGRQYNIVIGKGILKAKHIFFNSRKKEG